MSASNIGRGIPAAAGYPQYSGYLTSPVTSQKIIELHRCNTVFGEIASGEYFGEIAGCGDQVSFFREPEVIIRDHIKDGVIKHDTLEARQITLTIDHAHEFSVKIAHVDEKQMCNWPMMRQKLMESAAREMAHKVDITILNRLYADADPHNRGAQAGLQSKCYNLGQVGTPLVLTSANILDFLIDLGSVFDEQCIPAQDRWLVVPPKFKNLLLASDLRSVCFSGMSESTMLNGRLPNAIGGFNLYISNHLERQVDPVTNLPVFNLVAGYKGALMYANQLTNTRVIDNDKDSWDNYYQGMMVWGFGTVQPTGLAHIYANLA